MRSHRLLAMTALAALFTLPATVSADRRVDAGPGLEVLTTPATIAPATSTRSWRIETRRTLRGGQWRRHAPIWIDPERHHRGRGQAYGYDRGLKRGHDRRRIRTRHRADVKRWFQPVKRHPFRYRDHPDFAPHRWW